MAELFICPTGAVSEKTVRELRKAGVIVVESEKPEECKFIRATTPVSSDDMLWAAVASLQGETGYGASKQRETFSMRVFEIINAAYQARAQRPGGA